MRTDGTNSAPACTDEREQELMDCEHKATKPVYTWSLKEIKTDWQCIDCGAVIKEETIPLVQRKEDD